MRNDQATTPPPPEVITAQHLRCRQSEVVAALTRDDHPGYLLTVAGRPAARILPVTAPQAEQHRRSMLPPVDLAAFLQGATTWTLPRPTLAVETRR